MISAVHHVGHLRKSGIIRVGMRSLRESILGKKYQDKREDFVSKREKGHVKLRD